MDNPLHTWRLPLGLASPRLSGVRYHPLPHPLYSHCHHSTIAATAFASVKIFVIFSTIMDSRKLLHSIIQYAFEKGLLKYEEKGKTAANVIII